MPNGSYITSTHTCDLNLPRLPISARRAHLFQSCDLVSGSLLSIAEMCDAGLTVMYDKQHVKIYDKDSTQLLQGYRDATTNLWMIDLASALKSSPPLSTANAMHLPTLAAKVQYWHGVMGSPTPSTLLSAYEKGFFDIPGLTAAMIRKYPPNSIATAKGHLDRVRQGLRSTKTSDDYYNHDPSYVASPTNKHRPILTRIWNLTQQQYTDITGRFPVPSYTGKQYIMVMYCEDANYIHLEPMPSRKSADFVAAYKAGVEFFTKHGFPPAFDRLDNETSHALERYCTASNISIQYVPPNNHRANKAERAIRTFKNHFIAMLSSTDASFPLQAWDLLLPQAELTLNLLRPCHMNTAQSAWESVHGKYDFNKTPLAPVGTRVVIFQGPDQRESWAPHGIDGFYVGPALQHYRCYTVFVSKTLQTRITDTLSWHPDPQQCIPTVPADTPADTLTSIRDTLLTIDSHDITTMAQQPLQSIRDLADQLLQSLQSLSSLNPVETNPSTAADIITNTKEHNSSTPRALLPADAISESVTPSQRDVKAASEQNISQNSIELSVTNPTPMRNQRRSLRKRQPNRRYTQRIEAQANAIINDIPLTHSQCTPPPTPTSYMQAINAPHGEGPLWEQASIAEIDRLIESDTGKFIPWTAKPADRKASYYNPQLRVKIKNDGTIERRVRGTYGGDQSDYDGPVSAATAALPTIKLVLNDVVSDDASWMTTDIKDFYLGTPLKIKEYMRISLKHIPIEAQERHNIAAYAKDGHVMMEISKGIYGLPQAGKLAQDRLKQHLALHGYREAASTPCLFLHDHLPIVFTLVVDDFGIKYKTTEAAQHLLDTLSKLYTIKSDWTGRKYVGLTIDHNRSARTLSISMPGYVQSALHRFNITSAPPTHSPSLYVGHTYGSHNQYSVLDESPPLTPEGKKRIQQIVGVFLFYARAVDPTMLVSVSKLASMQANPTEDVAAAAERLLHYAATYPNATITYRASAMRLVCHSDASYLSESKSRSRAGGILFLGNSANSDINGAIDCISVILPVVVASAAEAEYGAAFTVAQEAEVARRTLADLGYPQEPTPIICDNACAVGLSNRSTKQKRSKAMDMRFHWLRDRVEQKHFDVIWREGKNNIADYFTKIHPTSHFKNMRHIFVHSTAETAAKLQELSRVIPASVGLRGCVDGWEDPPASGQTPNHTNASKPTPSNHYLRRTLV